MGRGVEVLAAKARRAKLGVAHVELPLDAAET